MQLSRSYLRVGQISWLGFITVTLLVLIPISAHATDGARPVFAVIHIDVVPASTDAAVALFGQYRKDSQSEPGEMRILVLQQDGRPNHFTLLEEWRAQADYDTHLGAAHTRHFREALQPMLGSPFDERLHTELP